MKGLIKPAFVLTLLLLALGELGARLFYAQKVSGRFEYGYHPSAGFVEHADGRVELFRAGGRRFYPQSFKKPRPPGTFRIMVIGDSVPRGPGLKEAYPWLLGEELRKHNIQAESLNLSVPGYGARRCRIVFKKVLEMDPSLIILHLNHSNEYEDEREFRRSREYQSWHPRHWPLKIFIFRRLYEVKLEKLFWRFIPEPIRVKYAKSDADVQVAASLDARQLEAWQRLVEEAAAEEVALARARHVPVLLITQCRLEPDARQSLSLNDHGLDALAKSLAGPGVYFLSMKEVFSGIPDLKSHFADTGHLKKSGHRLLAQAISQRIMGEQMSLGLPDLKAAKGGGG